MLSLIGVRLERKSEPRMEILALTKYGTNAASMRQRFLQYRPFLADAGLTLAISPLFDENYITNLYEQGKRSRVAIAKLYFRRLRAILDSGKHSLIWVHCESFPYLPAGLENLVFSRQRPVVFDFDDAIFHNYDLHDSWIVRHLLSSKLKGLLARSKVVFAGNDYLAHHATLAHARSVEVVPTVVDIDQYCIVDKASDSKPASIGWIGTPSTWHEYMAPMLPLLTHVADSCTARIRAVGAGNQAARHPLIDHVDWAEETEIADIQAMDVGIMPLDDTPWSRGKCGYKLIQYMACGLPVVASPVGVNRDIVDHGINGFLAETEQEWDVALRTLIADPALRRTMGKAGRRKIEKQYSLQVQGPRVASLLREIAMRSPRLQG